jgi:hypothetical protein
MSNILNLKMLKLSNFIGVIIMIVTIYGCKKYEDGPGLSFHSKKARVANTWKIDKYYVNGVDQTASYYSTRQNYRQIFDLNGEYAETYTNFGTTGIWNFIDNKNEINLTVGNSVKVLVIEKLKSKEFWYYIMVGTDKIEYQLIPA